MYDFYFYYFGLASQMHKFIRRIRGEYIVLTEIYVHVVYGN